MLTNKLLNQLDKELKFLHKLEKSKKIYNHNLSNKKIELKQDNQLLDKLNLPIKLKIELLMFLVMLFITKHLFNLLYMNIDKMLESNHQEIFKEHFHLLMKLLIIKIIQKKL